MATQKKTKSFKLAPAKTKPSKAVPAKKPVGKKPAAKKPLAKKPAAKKPAPKVAVKAKKIIKPAIAPKAKTTAKAVPASKAKKAAPVVKKPAAKPIQKSVAGKGVAATVSKVTSKAGSGKPMPKAQLKPVTTAKPIAKPAAKAIPQPVPKPITSKASNTVSRPNPKATSPGIKPALIGKPVVAPKAPIVKPATPKPLMQEKPKTTPKSIEPKQLVSPVKPEVKTTGSKISDLVKPSVSSKPLAEKPKEHVLPKEFQRKSLKQGPAHAVKSFDTMSDKKENKLMGVAFPEEPQKSRYNDKELEEFDQLIDQKLIVAREQLEFYLKQLEDMAENPDNKIKGLDDGLSTLESERVSSMASRQQKLIQHLENAKIRIKNKVYGICRETGKLISKERLRAVPHATLSIEAKQAQN